MKWNAFNQHFLAYPIAPRGGEFGLPTVPGLGMVLDATKIEAQQDVYAE